MTHVVCYFQGHQPYRLRNYRYFDVGGDGGYFDDGQNEAIVKRVAERCYLPMNALLLEQVRDPELAVRAAFSLSGTLLDQLEAWAPEALESFVELAGTGHVEFLSETSHHSLAALRDGGEFAAQVEDHSARVEQLFGRRPTTFRNTELIFDEELGRRLVDLGFEVLLGEGADRLLDGRSANRVYGLRGAPGLKLLLRSYAYSDDVAFRFSNTEWEGYPLLADHYVESLERMPADAPFVGLFMDYETFGEHQQVGTGIFEFMEHLPRCVAESERLTYSTPSEVAREFDVTEDLAVPEPVSWADEERDASAWLGNRMQRAAHDALYALAPRARAAGGETYETWRRLSTSDHFYYMCTKRRSDGDVHDYFSPYESPHAAYISFRNVLDDFAQRLQGRAEIHGETR